MPSDAAHWVFFEKAPDQVIKVVRKVGKLLDGLLCDLLEDTLERRLVERNLTSRHFIHDDSKRPEIGVKAQHAIVFEQLRCHVVNTASLVDALLFLAAICRRDQIRYLFREPEIGQFEL